MYIIEFSIVIRVFQIHVKRRKKTNMSHLI